MRIHSSVLRRDDFGLALQSSGLAAEGVYIGGLTVHGSRKRDRAFEVSLRAPEGRDRNGKARRWPNGGSYGACTYDHAKAATYDEWGYWLAQLFERDPDMIVAGCYDGRTQFHERTRDRYNYTPLAPVDA